MSRPLKYYVTSGDGDPRHGKISTYTNHKCRCEACCAANTAYYNDKRRSDPFWRERHNRQDRESRQRRSQVASS